MSTDIRLKTKELSENFGLSQKELINIVHAGQLEAEKSPEDGLLSYSLEDFTEAYVAYQEKQRSSQLESAAALLQRVMPGIQQGISETIEQKMVLVASIRDKKEAQIFEVLSTLGSQLVRLEASLTYWIKLGAQINNAAVAGLASQMPTAGLAGARRTFGVDTPVERQLAREPLAAQFDSARADQLLADGIFSNNAGVLEENLDQESHLTPPPAPREAARAAGPGLTSVPNARASGVAAPLGSASKAATPAPASVTLAPSANTQLPVPPAVVAASSSEAPRSTPTIKTEAASVQHPPRAVAGLPAVQPLGQDRGAAGAKASVSSLGSAVGSSGAAEVASMSRAEKAPIKTQVSVSAAAPLAKSGTAKASAKDGATLFNSMMQEHLQLSSGQEKLLSDQRSFLERLLTMSKVELKGSLSSSDLNTIDDILKLWEEQVADCPKFSFFWSSFSSIGGWIEEKLEKGIPLLVLFLAINRMSAGAIDCRDFLDLPIKR